MGGRPWHHTTQCWNKLTKNYSLHGKDLIYVASRRCYGKGPDGAFQGNAFRRYLKSLKWVPIPLSVGFAYICYQQYGHVVKREEKKLQTQQDPEDLVAKDWQVRAITLFPWNAMSRAWGRLNNLQLPHWLRKPFLGLYVRAFHCKMEEAAIQDLTQYENLGLLFRRRLKPGCRPVDSSHCMVSPSDGKVLIFGKMEDGKLEQVKGVTYSAREFLGPCDWPPHQAQPVTTAADSSQYEDSLKHNKKNCLYHCVIYLAPGDYHGFHSPTDWNMTFRRYFPGELLSVNPIVAHWIKGLFNINERAVYMGSWQHGFFAMAAIGATIVGSIKVFKDEGLETNSGTKYPAECHLDHLFTTGTAAAAADDAAPLIQKGEAFGEFNLGSTIVLLFEAPEDFKFKIKCGQKIKYGQPLGHCALKTGAGERHQG